MATKPIHFYNTLTRQTEELKTLVPGEVGLYCCGPTVYSYQHIGNLKTYLFEDILRRALEYAGYKVKHVMNITDVGHLASDADEGEDKMTIAMRREKKKSYEIAEFYTAKFFEDCAKMGIQKPHIVCKATDHIQEMIDLIKRIEANGFTYVSNGNVYFDVDKLKDYGKLAKLDLAKLKAGARIEVDPNKRGPYDFVLWFTKSKFENQELQWESPWGTGYPGWHIECSAMSMKYLGDRFDIHCGGIDHIPVHHTNEIAQSEAATGKPWVTMWLHGEFILKDGAKMSKSKGGVDLLDDVIANGYDPIALRYCFLTALYRAHLNFTWDALDGAQKSLDKLKNSVIALKAECGDSPAENGGAGFLKLKEEFETAIFDDLNTPRALAVIWSVLSDKTISASEKLGLLYGYDQVLGFNMHTWSAEKVEIPDSVHELLRKRADARKNKNWAESDKLRAEIASQGFLVEDKGSEQVVKKS